MSVLLETPERRLLPAWKVFSGHCRHDCYGGCGSVMVVPNEGDGYGAKLEDGDLYACKKCGTVHEYYMSFVSGARWATIRILRGVHVREQGEPAILEFVR